MTTAGKPASNPNTPGSLLRVQDLHIRFHTAEGLIHAVRGMNLTVEPGQCVGLVGESGSGKSQCCLAIMGLLAGNAEATGQIELQGRSLLDMSGRELDTCRGRVMSMVFQDPLTSLTPHLRIGIQLQEMLGHVPGLSTSQRRQRCSEALEQVRLDQPARRLNQYPHELSGGMRQRVMMAMALLCEPALLIADEPTTALDVTLQAELLELLDERRRSQSIGVLLITHDMGVVARMCDEVHVMRYGECVEQRPVRELFASPRHDYTRALLAAVPRFDAPVAASLGEVDRETEPLLRVHDLEVDFRLPKPDWWTPAPHFKAVCGVDLALWPGETLGIVGESGSGKSTLARAILQLVPSSVGQVSYLGRDLTALDRKIMRGLRADLQIVFQDPLASLDPSRTVGESILEPLLVHRPASSRAERRLAALEMMQHVGLEQSLYNRYPHELSGGQNQRVGIARAMVLKPRIVICDEAVSALDVSIQAQILALLGNLQREFGVALLFISHDLAVVRNVSHRILVLYEGQVVESGERETICRRAEHPYTRRLIEAVLVPEPAPVSSGASALR